MFVTVESNLLLTEVASQYSGLRILMLGSGVPLELPGEPGFSDWLYSCLRAIAVRTKAKLLDLPRKCVCFVSNFMFSKSSTTASALSTSSSMILVTPGVS